MASGWTAKEERSSRFGDPGAPRAARGLTEFDTKSSNAVEGTAAEEMAAEVEVGACAEVTPARTSTLHALLHQVFGRCFHRAGADRKPLLAGRRVCICGAFV